MTPESKYDQLFSCAEMNCNQTSYYVSQKNHSIFMMNNKILLQVDKDRVANIIALALQKQVNGEEDNTDAGAVDVPPSHPTGSAPTSRPVSQAEIGISRPHSQVDPLPIPPRSVSQYSG